MSIFCSCLLTLPISGRHWMGGGGGGHPTNNFSKALYDSGLTV